MYFFLAASIGDVSDCNQFLQELMVHSHTETFNTQHAGNSCKLPLQRYNNRLLLSA